MVSSAKIKVYSPLMTSFQPSETLKSALLEGLRDRGWFASPELVPTAIARSLREQLLLHKDSNSLKPAEIGRGAQKQARPDVRGDSILWIDFANPSELEKDFAEWLAEMKSFLNENLHLGLRTQELHYAAYPAGTGYQKHKDCFEKTDDRVLSFVLYLNEQWSADLGGQIFIYNEQNPDEKEEEILPVFPQCVIFLSANISHEVNMTKRERFSVTGWLKKTAPGALLPRF